MKKKYLLILCAVIMVFLLSACSSGKKAEPIQWTDLELGEFLPHQQNAKGKVNTDLTNALSITLNDISKEVYNSYRDACIEKGYTIESEDSGISYVAFNSTGYELRLTYYNNELDIRLTAPEKMDAIKWPSTGLGAMLPSPKSTVGRISWDNSSTFIVHIGNTTLAEFQEYRALCEEEGFVINHSKSEKYYSAENQDGYKLTLWYLGFNRIEISLKAPENINKQTETITPSTGSSSAEVIGTHFKAAMDSYERFMDEYVAFMKKYKANPTDITLLSSYADYMSKYAQFVADFSKWENEDLNAAELAYYIDVQARVSKKLLEVAQ